MAREIEYEIIGSTDRIIGHVWWDGKNIDSDNASLLEGLKDRMAGGTTFSAGKEFVQKLSLVYKNGYIRARKVSK